MLVNLDLISYEHYDLLYDALTRIGVKHINDICCLKSVPMMDAEAIYHATKHIAEMMNEGISQFLMFESEVRELKQWLGIQSFVETYYLATELDLEYNLTDIDRALFSLFYNLATDLGEV